MAKFKYVGESHRTFPTLNLEVDPGDVVEVAQNPDPVFSSPVFFVPVPAKAPSAAKS